MSPVPSSPSTAGEPPPKVTAPSRCPHLVPRPCDLQDTILHVITETACHAGHLDAVRELIDGRTWVILT
jgi:hypothetical protein